MKDNFARRYFGSTKCCLSSKWRYSAFDCPLAKFIWHTIHVSLDISPPLFFQHMFSDWLGKPKLYWIILIWSGVAAICWTIWLWRNEIVFDKSALRSYMELVFKGTYWWSQFGSFLQKEEDHFMLKTALRAAYLNREYAAIDIFASNG